MFETLGKHEILFDEESHRYCLLSDPTLSLTSVTTVIKKFSRPFDECTTAIKIAGKEGVPTSAILQRWEDKRNLSSSIGTLVHAEAERIANQLRMTGSYDRTYPKGEELISGHLAALWAFYDDHYDMCFRDGPYPEVQVVWPKHGIAGMIDLVCQLDGPACLVDFKTVEDLTIKAPENMYYPLNNCPDSNYFHYAAQLGLYSLILRDEYDIPVDRLMIVWLKPSGKYELWPVRTDANRMRSLVRAFERKME